MGVEPTAAGLEPPATDFEDQGAHRDTSLPGDIVQDEDAVEQGEVLNRGFQRFRDDRRIGGDARTVFEWRRVHTCLPVVEELARNRATV